MKYTFGRTQAAQRLETLLENEPSARRKVSSLLSNFTQRMLLMVGTKDPATVRLCWEMFRDYTLKRIDSKKGLSDDIRTYAKNVIIYRYRVYLHQFNELVAMMKQQSLTSGRKGV